MASTINIEQATISSSSVIPTAVERIVVASGMRVMNLRRRVSFVPGLRRIQVICVTAVSLHLYRSHSGDHGNQFLLGIAGVYLKDLKRCGTGRDSANHETNKSA